MLSWVWGIQENLIANCALNKLVVNDKIQIIGRVRIDAFHIFMNLPIRDLKGLGDLSMNSLWYRLRMIAITVNTNC